MAATSRPQREPVPLTCQHGHDFTTRAEPGKTIRCPTCRARKVDTSVWVPARATGAETEGPADDEYEFLPLTDADLTLSADPKQPCPDCGKPMTWTVGRTVLLCACSDRPSAHLPVAVGAHYRTIKQREAKARLATVAAKPDPGERLRKEIERAGENAQLCMEIDDVYDWAVWRVDTPHCGDAEFLRVPRERLVPLHSRANDADSPADRDIVRKALTVEARQIAERWGNAAYPGFGHWRNHGYVRPAALPPALPAGQPPALPARRPSALPASQPDEDEDDIIDVEWTDVSKGQSWIDVIGLVAKGLVGLQAVNSVQREPSKPVGPVFRYDGLCIAEAGRGQRCGARVTPAGGMVYCDSHADLWNEMRTDV